MGSRRAAAGAAGLALALTLAVAGCGGDDEEEPRAVPPPSTAPPRAEPSPGPHATDLKGPYLDGAISNISERELVLHVLPERRENPDVTFAIPDPPPPGFDLEHLRGDASGGVDVRIFYRRDGGRLVLRGYTHP